MTIERPMFPPRAESVQAFPPRTGTGQSETRTRSSEPPKPVEGLSRRTALAGLVVLPLALPAAAAAQALDVPAGIAADPAFALIAAHRATEIALCEVVDAQGEAEVKYGIRSAETWEAMDRSGDMCEELNAIAWKLADTPPTTLAGVAAVLRFANEVEDKGGDWPATDTIGSEGWHYHLRATMAAAVDAIARGGVRA